LELLAAKYGVPAEEVRMVFEGKQLEADSVLSECGVEAGACCFHAREPSHSLASLSAARSLSQE
jgi:hypothetical protein